MASSERIARLQHTPMAGEAERIADRVLALRRAGKDQEADQLMATVSQLKGGAAGSRGQLTYDQASDNVDKYLSSTAGMLYMSDLQKAAKKEGKPLNAMDIRSQLIRQAMTESGSTNAAKMPGAPSTASGGQRTIDWNSIK
jgi:hypothetical protein